MDLTEFDKPGAKVKLSAISEKPPKGLTQEKSQPEFEKLGQELFDLQDLLWGAKRNAVLVVLQGRDTRRQGRHHQARGGLPQPSRGQRGLLRRPHRTRSASTTSSGASTATRRGSGRVRHLQPLPLRGRARRARP